MLTRLLLSIPGILFRTEVCHHIHQGCHGLRLGLPDVPGELLVLQTRLEHSNSLDVFEVDDLISLLQETSLEGMNRFAFFLDHMSQVTTTSSPDICTIEIGYEFGFQVIPAGDRPGS